jgi:hypothetical protein
MCCEVMGMLSCHFLNLLLPGEFSLIKVACKVLALLQSLELLRIRMRAFWIRFMLSLR